MSGIKNKAIHNEEEVVALRNGFIQRARWMKLLIDQLKKSGDDWEEKAREAIRIYGSANGVRFQSEMSCPCVAELPNFVGAKWARKIYEIDVLEESEQKYAIDFHYCPLVAGWQMEGCTDEEIALLCDIAMDGDRSMAESVGVNFELGKRIANGDDVCELRFTNLK